MPARSLSKAPLAVSAVAAVFRRGVELLGRWHEVTRLVAEKWHGKEGYSPQLPPPEDCSLHKCRAVMNDNAADGTASLLVEEVRQSAVRYYGKEEWEAMSAKAKAASEEHLL